MARLLLIFVGTPLDRLARALLALQLRSWRARPELTGRLANFLPIGVASTLLQAFLLVTLTHAGMGAFPATVIAVQLSVLVNFTLNRLITWRDRFDALSPRQQRRWFVPLFLIFDLTTPTVWMKIVGITALERTLGLPLLLSWLIFEGIGAVANYLGADHISFGLMVKAIARLSDTSAAVRPAGTPRFRRQTQAAVWTAMRPHQWLKNGFVLAALPFAIEMGTPRIVAGLGALVVAFCAAASSVYLVNDLLDRERDRRHPTKRFRPIASGALSPRAAILLCATLTVGSLTLGFVIRPALALFLLAYLALSHTYTLAAKHVAYLDVALVGSLYGLRVAAGFTAVGVAFAVAWPWVTLTVLLATAVETGKRWSEWRLLGGYSATRPVLAAYGAAALPRLYLITAAAAVALSALAMWRLSPIAAASSLVVAVGFVRFWHDLNRLDRDSHPQEVFLGDCRLCALVGGYAVWFTCLVLFVG